MSDMILNDIPFFPATGYSESGSVDQTYNPNSSNAQSGTAVAEAILNKQNKDDDTLQTTNKSVVGAINELNSGKQNSTDNNLNTTSKNIVGAINEIESEKQDARDDTLTTTSKDIAGAINELNSDKAEVTYVDVADSKLQSQIDAITSSSDVVDVVGTYADLIDYGKSHLIKDNDIVKVLQDEDRNNAITYYRWVIDPNTDEGSWNYIGASGPYYTKEETNSYVSDQLADYYTETEVNALLNEKANAEEVQSALNLKADKATTYTKTETDNLLSNKVDKVSGKQLSTEDFTTAEKTKLAGIEAEATKNIVDEHYNETSDNAQSGKAVAEAVSTKADKSYVDSGLSGKADKSTTYTKTETDNLLADKVDKVSGKQLSTEDFTLALKTKLEGIETGAEVNDIDTIKVNGVAQSISNKEVDISVPTDTTDLTNGAGYVTSNEVWGQIDSHCYLKYKTTVNNPSQDPPTDQYFCIYESNRELRNYSDPIHFLGTIGIFSNTSKSIIDITVDFINADTSPIIRGFRSNNVSSFVEVIATYDATTNYQRIYIQLKAGYTYATLGSNYELAQEVTPESSPVGDKTVTMSDVIKVQPTKTSELTNDSGYITDTVNNLIYYYTKSEIDIKISAVYKYKGTVSTYADLPTTSLKIGDVYNIETADPTEGVKAGDNVAWTGTNWDVLSGTIDLSGYQTKIDSTHKLSADLVDDTFTTNKFVTSAEKTTWNTVTDKQDKDSISLQTISKNIVNSINENNELIKQLNNAEYKLVEALPSKGDYNTIYVKLTNSDVPLDIQKAMTEYVLANKNECIASELLSAVQVVAPTVTLDLTNNFYIKHAVPGVKDDTIDYPLNIPGSDGAVIAVFVIDNEYYPVVVPFAHEVETIHINETAIVGVSDGFTYDESGDVAAYSGSADKIVIPSTYTSGSIAKFSDLTTVQQVKVLIIENRIYLRDNAFENWDGLIAVQMAENTRDTAWCVFQNPNSIDAQFQNCDNLKYFKFPDWIDTTSWSNAPFPGYLFNGCSKLENVSIPQLRKVKNSESDDVIALINYDTFTVNNVREYIFPARYSDPNGWLKGLNPEAKGTRNVWWYTDNMTYNRAIAQASATGNELLNNGVTGNDLVNGMKGAIINSINASEISENTEISDQGNYVSITTSDMNYILLKETKDFYTTFIYIFNNWIRVGGLEEYLKTTSKTVIGAINELYNMMQSL